MTSTFVQVTLGILAAWTLITLVGTRLVKRWADTERMRARGHRELAVAIADELEARQRAREDHAWH